MSYQNLTLVQLKAQLAQKWDNVPFWTSDEATLAINESLRMWNLLTGMWKQTIVVTTAEGDQFVTIPGTITYNMRAMFNGRGLEPASLMEMDSGYPNWEGQLTSDGGSVPTTVKQWIPIGLNLIAIWPGDGVGQNSLTIDGVSSTPILVGDDDFVDVPPSEINTLLGYALHVASFKDLARWPLTYEYYKNFVKAAGSYNSKLSASALYRQILGLDMNNSERPSGIYMKPTP